MSLKPAARSAFEGRKSRHETDPVDGIADGLSGSGDG
jgi:hypothetical protein